MNVAEMYQEIIDQETADIFLDEDGFIIDVIDDYSIENLIDFEYDA